MANVRLPGPSHRTVIIGRTGSGKTFAGGWHLSLKNFKTQPWVIFDVKGDELLQEVARIPTVNRITLRDTPGRTGLYYMRLTPPQMKSDEMEAFLWRIHARGRCGLYVDEAYTLDPRSDAFNTICTQGRSLRIPLIALTQRPAWISRFIFSEADFFQVFGLNGDDDRKTVEKFVPTDMSILLREFHSTWYDVGRNDVREFSPVPQRDVILNSFDEALRPKTRVM